MPDPSALRARTEVLLRLARNYWIASSGPDHGPHAAPVWGVWVDGGLWFGTESATRKARNLLADPRVVVHLDSGDDVVMFEGRVEVVAHDAIPETVVDAYAVKYVDGDKGEPMDLRGALGPDALLFVARPLRWHTWLEAAYLDTQQHWDDGEAPASAPPGAERRADAEAFAHVTDPAEGSADADADADAGAASAVSVPEVSADLVANAFDGVWEPSTIESLRAFLSGDRDHLLVDRAELDLLQGAVFGDAVVIGVGPAGGDGVAVTALVAGETVDLIVTVRGGVLHFDPPAPPPLVVAAADALGRFLTERDRKLSRLGAAGEGLRVETAPLR